MNQTYPKEWQARLDREAEFYTRFTGKMDVSIMDGNQTIFHLTGGDMIAVSQRLLEIFDTDTPGIERLPDNAYRFGQYRLEHVATYPEHDIVQFQVFELSPEEIPPDYWERLRRWKVYQGLA